MKKERVQQHRNTMDHKRMLWQLYAKKMDNQE